MTCEELLQALNEYVDGNVDLPECARFASHLAGCNPCQVVVDNIRGTIRLFKAGKPYPLPREFQDRLRSTLAAKWRAKYGAA